MSSKELSGIVNRYSKYMMDFIGRYVKNPQDIEDILQEVWLILAQRGPDMIDHKRLCGYLRRTAMSAKNEYYRRHTTFTDDVVSYRFERINPTYDVHESFESEYCHSLMMMYVGRLSPKLRRYVLDFYIKGFSIEVIASNAGVTYEAVRKPVMDFATNLRRAYGKYV